MSLVLVSTFEDSSRLSEVFISSMRKMSMILKFMTMRLRTSYQWLDSNVKEYFSQSRWSLVLHSFTGMEHILEGCIAWLTDFSGLFLYFYVSLIIDIHVWFPLGESTTTIMCAKCCSHIIVPKRFTLLARPSNLVYGAPLKAC